MVLVIQNRVSVLLRHHFCLVYSFIHEELVFAEDVTAEVFGQIGQLVDLDFEVELLV